MALLQHSCSTHATTFVFCSARDWNFWPTLLHNRSLEKSSLRLYVYKRPESMLVLRLERWLSLEQLQNELPVHFNCSGCSLKGRSRIKYWRGTRTTSPPEFYLTNPCQPECTLTCALHESKKTKFCLLNVLECSLVDTSAFTSSGLLPLFFSGHVRAVFEFPFMSWIEVILHVCMCWNCALQNQLEAEHHYGCRVLLFKGYSTLASSIAMVASAFFKINLSGT